MNRIDRLYRILFAALLWLPLATPAQDADASAEPRAEAAAEDPAAVMLGVARALKEQQPALAYVRYMDDCIWWCADRPTARTTLAAARDYLASERLLTVKADAQINRSVRGVTFCGFRILPGTIRLTARKRRRYAERRAA